MRAWDTYASRQEWQSPADIRALFNSLDFVAANHAIFSIGGNSYRLVAHVFYAYRPVLVKFVRTHAEYDRIEPESV